MSIRVESISLPHGKMVPPGPRAAASHSYSVGRRRPAQLQKASASQKPRWRAGRRFWPASFKLTEHHPEMHFESTRRRVTSNKDPD